MIPLPEPGDIIQIVPAHHWARALAVVDEVKPWGVVAYVIVPHNDGTGGAAYIRLRSVDFERIPAKAVFGL